MRTPVSLATESLVWYRAMTLAERVAAPVAVASTALGHAQLNDVERAQYCLNSWKAQKPFQDAGLFQQRLGLQNLTEDDLRRLVCEPVDHIRSRFATAPDWVATIEAALSSNPSFEFHNFLSNRLRRDPFSGFLDAAAPFINLGLRQLETDASALARRTADCPFEPSTIRGFLFPDFAHALLRIIGRAMVLELNVARLEETLVGSTSEERFASFITQLHDPSRLRTLFEEYPVLARLLAEQTNRWVTVSLELLGRLSEDFDTLEEAFGGAQGLGSLVGVSMELADPHAGGRSVAIVKFSSGTSIVYKPKSLAVDAHFQDVLRWLTAEGFAPGFRTLTILDRSTYGWSEFASAEACRTRDDVIRFYERMGGYLALLFAMNARDFHAGNVIASREHPVLIDLEALFHPHRSLPVDREVASADKIASRLVRNSVLRIGLLPERMWGNAEHEGVDISGLGACDGQMTPYPVAAWAESGADTMRLVRKRKAIKTDLNRPTLNGEPVDVVPHRDAILRGFRSSYSILAARHDVLLTPDGPFGRFGQDSVCVFLRSSRTYRRLLRESYHPDVLRDALDRDRLFDLLWVAIPDDDHLIEVIQAEQSDLWKGDIPRFTARPASRDLRGTGEKIREDFFPEPALSAVQRILDQMGDAGCARQAWFVEASLASLPGALGAQRSYRAVPSDSPVDRERLLAAAVAVGNRLEQLAVRGAEDATWIGLELEGRRVWSIAEAGVDLDAGIPGIALFLAYLGAVTESESATALARAALASMRDALKERSVSRIGVGGFEGLGGVIYVLSHLSTMWCRHDLLDEATDLAARLPEIIDKDDEFDISGGAAGCILALRSLQQCVRSDRLTAIAIQCGDHLLRSLESTESIGTPPSGAVGAPSGGAGPAGASGIAYALLELDAWTGIERYQALALEMLDGEGARFVETVTANQRPASHPDGPDDDGLWTTSGREARGVDLYHLCCSLATINAPAARAETAAIVQLIRNRGFGWNHSLGHGDFGSLELLTRGAFLLEDEGLIREADRMASTILKDIEQHGWRCGTPLSVETPGLLSGLAGIGYGLLRSARPDVVPSVLALEPPIQSRCTNGH
jgi:type 2 lantibiotic biosynthesis protein LanM